MNYQQAINNSIITYRPSKGIGILPVSLTSGCEQVCNLVSQSYFQNRCNPLTSILFIWRSVGLGALGPRLQSPWFLSGSENFGLTLRPLSLWPPEEIILEVAAESLIRGTGGLLGALLGGRSREKKAPFRRSRPGRGARGHRERSLLAARRGEPGCPRRGPRRRSPVPAAAAGSGDAVHPLRC